MADLIPKEQLSAYERWEMAAFDEAQAEARNKARQATPHVPPPAAPPEPPPAAPVPLAESHAEELDALRKAALQKGFEEGLQSGHAQGEAAARQDAAKIAALMQGLHDEIAAAEHAVADDLLTLAIEIAQRMVRGALRVRPDLLLPVVRDALAALPNPDAPLTLHLHPDDATLLRNHLPEMAGHDNWRIVADERLARGGCRLVSGGSEVDATAASRWRLIVEALGQDTAWLGNE